ncbi:MAG: hypothetical protein ACLFR0_04090 [Alphaproteobacteria bacterium]
MSYTKTFGAAVLAAGLSTNAMGQTMTEPYSPVEEITTSEELAYGLFLLNSFIPPEMKSILQGAEISTTTRVGFGNDGNISTLYADLDLENIDCDILGEFYELYGPTDMEKQFLPPEDKLTAEAIETLLEDRHFQLRESFAKADLTAMDLEGLSDQEIAMIPETVTLNLEASCSDYVAPPPSFTPVEPN